MESKKGIQLSQAFSAVLAVVLVAILVIVGLVLFEALADTGIDQAHTVESEAGGFINSSGYNLNAATTCGFNTVAIVNAGNVSQPTIEAANYTVSEAGLVTNLTAENWVAVRFNYTYNDRGATCNASEDIIDQFATYPALVGLVGTIIFLGLVIGVLVASFLLGDRRRV